MPTSHRVELLNYGPKLIIQRNKVAKDGYRGPMSDVIPELEI